MDLSSIFNKIAESRAEIAARAAKLATQSAQLTPPVEVEFGPAPPTLPTPQPTGDIERIAAKLPKTLVAIRNDAGKIVHDSAGIGAKCTLRGHIHSYFISDIEAGAVSCKTCNSGTAFMRAVRTVGEALLCAPLVLEGGEYMNPVLRVRVKMVKTAGEDSFSCNRGDVTITIHHTKSSKKIHATYAVALIDHPPCAKIRRNLEPFLPKKPLHVEEPDDLPVIERNPRERLCIENC